MKKSVSLLLALAIVFALCGCEVSENTAIEQQNSFMKSDIKEENLDEKILETTNTEKVDLIVYMTRTGVKYHRSGCQYLSNSKIETTVESAKARGLKPCSVCYPPQ